MTAAAVLMGRTPRYEGKGGRKTRQETAQGAVRFTRGLGRRIASEGDADDLASLKQVEESAHDAISEAVAGLRARGFSWTEIGRGFGITRTAAHDRWGKGEG